IGVKKMYELHQLLSQLKDYEWVNLSHEVHEEIPFYHTFNPLKETVISSMDEDNVYSLEYTIGSSHGTHIDAPSHFAEGKRDLLDIPQKERALPLYVIHLEDKVKEDPGYAITVEDIKTLKQNMVKYQPIASSRFRVVGIKDFTIQMSLRMRMKRA